MNMMLLSKKRWDQRAKDIEERIKKKHSGAPGWRVIQLELAKAVHCSKPDCIMVDEDRYMEIKKHCLSKAFAVRKVPYRRRKNAT